MFSVLDWVERTSFVFIVFILVFLGFVQGFRVHSFTVDLFFVVFSVLWMDAVFSSLFFAGFFVFSGFLFLVKLARWSPGEKGSGSVTCVVPTYMDADVLHRSVESLKDSDYSDFQVLIICEEDDEDSMDVAEDLSEMEGVDFLVNDRYPGSKAGAMNFAAEVSDSDYIAFFDSDQYVRSDFLSAAVSQLQSCDVVTGRNLPKTDGFVESLSYYESVFFTYVARKILSLLTGFRLVGSRSVVMKREVFESLGGYREDVLTEDYDFTHRCYINGFDVVNIPLPIENLAAHSFRDWWGQRKRWMTGYFQVFVKRLREAFTNYRGYRSIVSVLISGGSLVGSFLMLTIVSKFLILLLIGTEWNYVLPISVIAILALVFRLHDLRYNFVDRIGFSWLVVPAIFPLFSLITVRSFVEYLFERDMDWYRVEK